jgi:hypothetical protein
MNRLGVDYDGTIADTNAQKAAWIRQQLGIDVPSWQCDRTSCVPIIGSEHYRAMCDVVYEEQATLAASPVRGAIEAVRMLSASASVYVVTARLRHRVHYARQWLCRHGLMQSLAGVLCSADATKGSLCERFGLDVLIEDDARHLQPLIGSATRPMLLRLGVAEPVRGLPTFASWEALLEDLGA